MNPNPASQQRVKFNTALEFLERVKNVFQHQPPVYNNFLDIMKDFKNQSIDTPGVILRVKTLFKGHPDLIEGFNNFLPPGYKIEADEEDEAIEAANNAPAQVAPTPPPATVSRRQAAANNAAAQDAMQVEQPAAAEPRRQPEFDKARLYVKQIKTRFNNQPHVYKQFLEILHTFHREQHTINDVYAQVAKLFKDHPDLLSEFSQFLPASDPAQQAQLNATVSGANLPTSPEDAQTRGINTRGSRRPEPRAEPQARVSRTGRAREERREGSYGTFEEVQFFTRVKHALCGGWNQMSQGWEEFIKCLALYNQDIITRGEVYSLVKELLRPHDPELIVWLRNFLGVDDSEPTEIGLNELDWSTANKLGPSYRELPDKLKEQLKCSGRQEDKLLNEVLNDTWVSVPLGSEDGTFKNSRKNQYEELLFKCEDDRFELDMLIESTSGAIKWLDDLLQSIKQLPAEEQPLYHVRDDELDVLHARTIKRVYAHRGEDIVRFLSANPTKAIPVVVNRLKQKYVEWGNARRDWGKIWRHISKHNYNKALDHQSIAFKQEEKKTLVPKALVKELKVKAASSKRDANAATLADTAPAHLEFTFKDPKLWADVKKLLIQVYDVGGIKGDKTKFEELFNEFFGSFFGFYTPAEAKPAADGMEVVPKEEVPVGGSVKPLATLAEQPATSPKIFLCNDSMYTLFRYLQVLLERLTTAKEIARRPSPTHSGTPAEEAVKTMLGEQKPDPLNPAASGAAVKTEPQATTTTSNTGDVVMADDGKAAEPAPEVLYDDATTLRRYNELFLPKVETLIANGDISAFEEEMRDTFGLNCFALFTLDRLLTLVAKQIHYATTDDICEQLVELYEYEIQRPNAFSDLTYFNNTKELLQGDKRIFKFLYNPTTGVLGITEIPIAVPEGEKEKQEAEKDQATKSPPRSPVDGKDKLAPPSSLGDATSALAALEASAQALGSPDSK